MDGIGKISHAGYSSYQDGIDNEATFHGYKIEIYRKMRPFLNRSKIFFDK